jgi:DNA-directed RNA polymerase subunit M/transcription elongation factor TFIIS
MADGVNKEVGTVRCSCGAKVSVAADAVNREQTCPSCSAKFKVLWAVDPKTREKILARVPAKGNAIRIPAGSQELVCACGQVLVARKDQAGRRMKCPVCGGTMTLERYKDPLTMETKVRRQDNQPPPPSKGETSFIAAKSLGRTTRRRRAPEGAQDILCQCGEYLRVVVEQLDKKVMCPACGTLMKLEKVEGGATKVRPRIVGKTEPPAPIDPDQWSMEDFK